MLTYVLVYLIIGVVLALLFGFVLYPKEVGVDSGMVLMFLWPISLLLILISVLQILFFKKE